MSYNRFLNHYPLPDHCRQPRPQGPPQLSRRGRRFVWVVVCAFVASLFAIAGLAHG